MNIPPKQYRKQTFEGGIDTDSAPEYIPQNRARYMLNCRAFSFGNIGVITNIRGNTLVFTSLPAGTNQTIGSYADEANNRFFFFVYNSNGYHTIYQYSDINQQVSVVFQSITQSDDIDILTFDPNYPILHIDIVAENLIYWVDGLNKARKFNIAKMLDSSPLGYGLSVLSEYITAYKQTAPFAPTCAYFTDTTRNANNLYANLFKFTLQFIYDDGELSNWSDWSKVPLPTSETYIGVGNITNTNNAINVNVATGSRLVKKIQIAVKVNNTQLNADNQIQSTDFVICQVLDKDELNISDNSTYTWVFYNDGSYSSTDQAKINRINPALPRVPLCQSFVKNAITYSNFTEGFDKVLVDASVNISWVDLYIPPGVQNQLNNPSITVDLVSVDKVRRIGLIIAIVEIVRYNPIYRFTIGADVKAGNIFRVYGRNGGQSILQKLNNVPFIDPHKGGSDNYYYEYKAGPNDTAGTVAANIKNFLRSIGRGYPSNAAAITNETQNADGSNSFDYGYLGKWKETQTVFSGSVNPVNYETLKDDGTSINIIKYGTTRNYAFVYIDDDGRESNAYTSSTCVIRTPFITEIGLNSNGDYQQPVHTITINHRPPLWAKYWRLVRTPDTSTFIWVLIQQVIEVDPQDGAGTYLDLTIGSLPTYNELHPNSILAYDFARGDRLRPICSDTTTGTLYTKFYDCEVLGYNVETSQQMNGLVTVNGTNIVSVTVQVLASQAGFYIQINGNERLITAVNTGSNQYTLDQPIASDNTTNPLTPVSYSNYVLIDRRGTIRISKPNGITIVPNSIIELYKPPASDISPDYMLFFDFGIKYPILNWGTSQAYHSCNTQNQTDLLPGLMTIINGDAYIRNREYPTNTIFPGTEVVVYKAVDPNFSDFYYSDLHDIGRVYPQDTGIGAKHFGSRVRFSNNYIQDSSINGLNDFDNADRKDFDDPYGDIMLTKYRESRMWAFKQLRDAWVPINHTLTTDAQGNTLLAATEFLLNEMQYLAWEGGIGNNPESWTSNGTMQYHASPNSGVFLRIGGDGQDAISTIYQFDTATRQLLQIVDRFKLRLYSGVDRKNSEILWTILPYIPVLYGNDFTANTWITDDGVITGATGVVVTQPANGNVVYDPVSGNFVVTMNSGFVGSDGFTYKLQLSGGGFSAVKNCCITVVEPANRPKGYRTRASSAACELTTTPPPPPTYSTININNTTTDFTMAYVKAFQGSTTVFSKTNVTPGWSSSDSILVGSYTINVKIFASTDGGTGILRISSNGVVTPYSIPSSGLTITQYLVHTPIIVELDAF
jgi:hypothetical protein